jgi:hypothetical protein
MPGYIRTRVQKEVVKGVAGRAAAHVRVQVHGGATVSGVASGFPVWGVTGGLGGSHYQRDRRYPGTRPLTSVVQWSSP